MQRVLVTQEEVASDDLQPLFDALVARLRQLDGQLPQARGALLECSQGLQQLQLTAMRELARHQQRVVALQAELAQWLAAGD
jgi:hypothetical protein